MKPENILPVTGAFTLGLFLGILLFALFIPQYQCEVSHADQVVEECIEQYDVFYDTIAEGDNLDNYENLCHH